MNKIFDFLGVAAIIVGTFLAVFAVTALVMAIPVLIFWLAWNAVVPGLFGLPSISFWQAFGLVILLSFLRSTISIATGSKKK